VFCQWGTQFSRGALGRARTASIPDPQFARVPLAVVPAFAEPGIQSPSRARKGRHTGLSVCSLPVLKQSEGSLGRFISFAQSVSGRTWQSARCVILVFVSRRRGF